MYVGLTSIVFKRMGLLLVLLSTGEEFDFVDDFRLSIETGLISLISSVD